MQALVKAFEIEELKQVSTVLASGNLLFQSDLPAVELKELLRATLEKRFNFKSEIFLLTIEQIASILKENPLKQNADFHSYVVISEQTGEWLLNEVLPLELLPGELLKISSGVLYWQVSKNSTTDSNVSKALARRALKPRTTVRNFNTVEKIYQKLNSILPS